MSNTLRLSAIAAACTLLFQTSYAQEVPLSVNSEEKNLNQASDQAKKIKSDQLQKTEKETSNIAIQKVQINGGRQSDLDERKRSTAAKMIFGREELDRNGDSNLAEILKRLPGVSIGGRPGRGGDIRMRGMGNGYTQILINGERAPRGFSMDSLSPDQVERIEIMRGPVAEFSTQAIAGTINIILREEYRQKDIDIKITESFEQGRSAPNLSLTVPLQAGSVSYVLSGSVFQNQQKDQSFSHNEDHNLAGETILTQDITDLTQRKTKGIHLTPRFNYRAENGDTLTFQPFLMVSRSESTINSLLDQTIFKENPANNAAEKYAVAYANSSSETNFLRGFGNWQHRFENQGKLNLKFGGGLGRMDSYSLRTQYASQQAMQQATSLDIISDVNNTRDSSFNLGAKYNMPLGESHTIASGLEFETSHRDQTRISLENGKPQFADSGDNLAASTRRVAAFIQDEFDISPQWSAYAGLRWEGISTRSGEASGYSESTQLTGHKVATVKNDSSVWSPLLHAVWRLPGGTKDQIRMSLTSSYRAPALNDLIALPARSYPNSQSKPDRTGNPLLKPELSKGIDFAVEHYLSRAGILTASLFYRKIDQLIRRSTHEQQISATEKRFVSSPENIGLAMTKGIELEAKFQLQEFSPDAPAIDIRSNYSHYWSSVKGVSGPDNRLDQQPVQSVNFGFDYRAHNLPLTLGASYNWTPAYQVQNSDTQLSSNGIKKQIDLYGVWKFTPNLQLRLSGSNLQANDYFSGSINSYKDIVHMAVNTAKTYSTFSVKLEIKI